jgi:hypothetical protein
MHGASCEDDALYAQTPQGHLESTRQIHGQRKTIVPWDETRERYTVSCDVDVDEDVSFGTQETELPS